jgi:hypothetical protein
MNSPGSPAAAAVSEDIRDIRGPKPIASVWLVPALALAGLLVVGGAYSYWRWNRRRQGFPRKSPSAIALERLERARTLMQPSRGREFSIEASSIVRDYIETRFQVRATHLTTDEFLREHLEASQSLLAAHRDLLGEFLQSCDLAKFGGWNLMEQNMEAMLQSARRFVIESARPEAAKSQRAESSSAIARETYDSLPTT